MPAKFQPSSTLSSASMRQSAPMKFHGTPTPIFPPPAPRVDPSQAFILEPALTHIHRVYHDLTPLTWSDDKTPTKPRKKYRPTRDQREREKQRKKSKNEEKRLTVFKSVFDTCDPPSDEIDALAEEMREYHEEHQRAALIASIPHPSLQREKE